MSAESLDTSRLTEITRELEGASAELSAGDADRDRANELAQRCAELAAEAAIELDRLARSAPGTSLPGQEELL